MRPQGTCYTIQHMRGNVRWLLQGLVFAALVAVGAWVRCLRLNDPMPTPGEAPHAVAAAARAEAFAATGWPKGTMTRESPFHVAAALCAHFMGEGRQHPHVRCYRAFSLATGVIFLPLLLSLGLRRRGGVFATADGPLWAVTAAALSPALAWQGWTVGPQALQALLFLAALTAARSYAQWPGYVPAAAMGALWAVAVAVEPDALWVLAVAVPSVMLGVGWTRLCLYWRTLHVALAATVGVGLWSFLCQQGLTGTPTLPTLPATAAEWLTGPLWRLRHPCVWGLGAVAWAGLATWGICRPDRRWARTLAALFLFVFAGSLFFREGGAFAVPLTALTPVLAGAALSAIPRPWVRWTLGNATAMALCVALTSAVLDDTAARPLRATQKTAFGTLAAGASAPKTHPCRIRVQGAGPNACAALLWPLRTESGRVEASETALFADADILIVEESRLGMLPPSVGQWIRPGRACVAPGLAFRVFAAPPNVGISWE